MRSCRRSGETDVLGFFALTPRRYVELYDLAGLERLVAVALDVGVVNEDVVTLLTVDKSEALLSVEELHGSCSQLHLFSPRLGLGLKVESHEGTCEAGPDTAEATHPLADLAVGQPYDEEQEDLGFLGR